MWKDSFAHHTDDWLLATSVLSVILHWGVRVDGNSLVHIVVLCLEAPSASFQALGLQVSAAPTTMSRKPPHSSEISERTELKVGS